MSKTNQVWGKGGRSRAQPSPAEVEALVSSFQNGQWERLESRARAFSKRYPHDAMGWKALGVALFSQVKLEPAVFFLTKAVALADDDPDARFNLGMALQGLGRFDAAIGALREAFRLAPDRIETVFSLASTYQAAGRVEAAAACYTRTLALMPASIPVWVNLGAEFYNQGRPETAIRVFIRALRLDPGNPQTLYNLGNALRDDGRGDEAVRCYRAALALSPDYRQAYNNLAQVYREAGRIERAISACRAAVAIDPRYHHALNSLGTCWREAGAFDRATLAYDAALAQTSGGGAAAGGEALANALYTSHYAPDTTPESHVAMAHRYGARVTPVPARQAKMGVPPGRPLRIGYVSGDFREHPVSHFLAPVLEAHDPTAVEVFCYDNNGVEDDWTARLRRAVAHWRQIARMTDAEADALVRDDAIDVLVDLSGHTAGHRLRLFAGRPAPVQFSWLGYWGTTGVPAIDAVLVDDAMVPAGLEGWFTEAVVRLPGGRFAYAPPVHAPAVTAPPLQANGHVTFGCFNRPCKMTTEVFSAWARILAGVDGARLVLKARMFRWPEERARILAVFEKAGGDPARLELRPDSPHTTMLAEYGDIDIALDPFPFSGGTTSYEAMWMGVPVVTLAGDRPVSRQTLGLLRALGLDTQLAAAGVVDYVDLAIALARDAGQLAELRHSLRAKMAASPACDGVRLARSLEAVYRRYRLGRLAGPG